MTPEKFLEEFGSLAETVGGISKVREAILQLAVTGKLVNQDTGEARGSKVEPQQTGQEEVPFQLPSTWRWTNLGTFAELINGDRGKNYPNRSEYVQDGVAWINTGHIEPDGSLSMTKMHYITREKFDSLRSGKVRPGDLVYCLRGATLGKTAIVTQFAEGAVASSLVIIRLSEAVEGAFAYRYLTSPFGRTQIFRFDNGSAQPNLSANSVKKYWVPIPPLPEQKRIVAKVDQLMALCDELEAKQKQKRETATRLNKAALNAVVTAPT